MSPPTFFGSGSIPCDSGSADKPVICRGPSSATVIYAPARIHSRSVLVPKWKCTTTSRVTRSLKCISTACLPVRWAAAAFPIRSGSSSVMSNLLLRKRRRLPSSSHGLEHTYGALHLERHQQCTDERPVAADRAVRGIGDSHHAPLSGGADTSADLERRARDRAAVHH